MGIEPTPALVVVFRAHATHTMRYFPILFFWLLGYVLLLHGWGVILCVPFRTPPMKNYESKIRFSCFSTVPPLPPPKGAKDQGRKLAPGNGKDIIAYSRAEPSGLNPPGFTLATDNATAQFPRKRALSRKRGEGGSIQFIENAGGVACVQKYWVMGVP